MAGSRDFRSSLIKFCQDSIAGMVTDGIVPTAEFCNFDAHSQLTDLPEDNLVGVSNYHWINDGHFYTVGASIGVSSWQDTNLFRHTDMIDWLEPKLLPMRQIPLLDATTGEAIGWMVVEEGVSLMPMMRTDTRSLQFYMVSFLTSLTA